MTMLLGRRRGRGDRQLGVLGAGLLAGTPLLVLRMRRDLAETGELRTSTATWMWSTYATYGVVTSAALTAPPAAPRLPRTLRCAGTVLTAAGVVADVAGLRRFAGPAQLTGTVAGDLVTGGVYRYSRHPQYTGLVAMLTGLALVRRSPTALVLSAGLAVTYRAWVPIEEQHLVRHFGEPYARYRASTSRWIGRPRRSDEAQRRGQAGRDDKESS